MNKLPVAGTVSKVYGFLLGDIATIVRLSWLPFALAAALNFYVGGLSMDELIAAGGKPGTASAMGPASFLASIAAFAASVMVTVALIRVVMYGERNPGMPFYLWFGVTEIRLVIVYLLLVVAMFAAVIGAILALGIVAALAAASKGGEAVAGLITIGVFGAAIWAALKLSIIPAVVVSERNLGVERAWALMRGNALRMFLIMVLTLLPFAVLSLLLVGAAVGGDFPVLPNFKELMQPAGDQTALKAAMEAWMLDFMKAMRKHWLELSVVNYVTTIFSTAIFAGIAGNAYLALAGEPER